MLGLADWQCADAKIPALPPPSALAEYPLPPDADYPAAFSEVDKLQADSSLTASDLLTDRYRKRFARLLALEEGQMARDIAQYTLYGVTVKPLATSPDPDESPDCVIIIVKGAMEQRPALTFGDIVRIRLAASGSGEHTLPGCLLEWQGRVLNVNQDKVAVKLRKSNIGSSAKVCHVCSRKAYAVRAPCGCQICDGRVRQQLLQLCAGMPADKVRQTLGGRAAWIAAWSALHRKGASPQISSWSASWLRTTGRKTLTSSKTSSMLSRENLRSSSSIRRTARSTWRSRSIGCRSGTCTALWRTSAACGT